MIELLASLEKLVVKLRQKKQEATKLRKRAENQLKEVRSTERRSTSGLHSIDKKIELEREDVSDVSGVLTQKNAQLESIERLINSAEERLSREKEEIERTQQEIDFSESPEEKQNAEFRLRSLNEHVSELVAEIKSRQKTAKKITIDVTQFSDVKSKITTKIQKQSKSKPTLRDAASTSHKAAAKFVKELERRTKSEESAKKVLDKTSAKLQELLKKRKPAKKKVAKRKPARKTAAKRKVVKRKPARKTAAKRKVVKRKPAKKATKKKVAKRKPARKTAAKRKVVKRKPAKKATKKKVAKRKPARKTAAKRKVVKRKPAKKATKKKVAKRKPARKSRR